MAQRRRPGNSGSKPPARQNGGLSTAVLRNQSDLGCPNCGTSRLLQDRSMEQPATRARRSRGMPISFQPAIIIATDRMTEPMIDAACLGRGERADMHNGPRSTAWSSPRAVKLASKVATDQDALSDWSATCGRRKVEHSYGSIMPVSAADSPKVLAMAFISQTICHRRFRRAISGTAKAAGSATYTRSPFAQVRGLGSGWLIRIQVRSPTRLIIG